MMLRGHVVVSRFLASSSSSSSSYVPQYAKFTSVHSPLRSQIGRRVVKPGISIVACSSTVQEPSTSTVAGDENKEAKASPKPASAKPKAPAKAPPKPLPQIMEEEIIPSLKSTLEAYKDLDDLEISFQDNTLEGSFVKKGDIPYSFWAFFPSGSLTGPKGFSLSSYGLGPSSVEPFLVDEKTITAKIVVFWVKKRLAAQGIIPVWNE